MIRINLHSKRCVLLAFLALAVASCSSQSFVPQLRLSITDWPGYEYFYLASRKGLDQRQGYRLQVDQFASLEDQRRAFSQGLVDAIATTLPGAVAICREAPSRCPVIVLVLDQSNGADQLIGAAPLRSPADLVGKRVGLESDLLSVFMLLRSLEGTGLHLSDIELVHATPKALVDQLRRGGLDAIVSYSPHSDALLADPRWRVLFSSSEIPGEVVDVLAVSPALLRDHPAQVQALVNTWWDARALAVEQPQMAAALMAQRQGVTPQQFVASQRLIDYPDRTKQSALLAPDGPVQRALLQMVGHLRQEAQVPAELPLPQLQSEFSQ